MCGRYSQTFDLSRLQERFGFKDTHIKLKSRYNLAPAQQAPVVVSEGLKTLRLMKWGLVPFWAKDADQGMINARAETVAAKPSFRKPFARQRCLVITDGFYEWKRVAGTKKKIPMRITLKNKEPFAMAGIWDMWSKPNTDGIRTFAIITTQANSMMKPIHDRMPVIVKKEDEERWLDPKSKDLQSLLVPYDSANMHSFEISTLVNSPYNDTPACLEPCGS